LRVLFLITELNIGGAGLALTRLLASLAGRGFEAAVISLRDQGALADRIQALGLPVWALGLRGSWPGPGSCLRLAGLVRQVRPDLIQGWMYHGNLAAAWAAARLDTAVPLVWSIRHSVHDLQDEKRTTRWVIRAGAWLSSRPRRILYNSRGSARQHESLGYRPDKTLVIPNGFDCRLFRPDPEARAKVRQELGFDEDCLLIGLIARYHPMKDHRTFLRAAALLAGDFDQVRFLLAGPGVEPDNPHLARQVRRLGLQDRVLLLGERRDTPALNAALDVAVSSSFGEGFSNAIGEAMACGTACVATDVGDSALVLDRTGLVAPPKNPAALAGAMQSLIEGGPDLRRALGLAARRRIKDHFALKAVAGRYRALYRELGPTGTSQPERP